MKKEDEENRKRALKLLVITDSQVLLSVLEAVRDELEDRTQAIRNGDPVPRIVVVADEYAGLMVSHSERAEPLLAKMLVLGRAAGVHFIFATQRPDEVVMSPSLRCGFPGYYMPAINDARYQASEKLAMMTCTDNEASTTYMAPDDFVFTFQLASEVIEVMVEDVIIGGMDTEAALLKAEAGAEALLK